MAEHEQPFQEPDEFLVELGKELIMLITTMIAKKTISTIQSKFRITVYSGGKNQLVSITVEGDLNKGLD